MAVARYRMICLVHVILYWLEIQSMDYYLFNTLVYNDGTFSLVLQIWTCFWTFTNLASRGFKHRDYLVVALKQEDVTSLQSEIHTFTIHRQGNSNTRPCDHKSSCYATTTSIQGTQSKKYGLIRVFFKKFCYKEQCMCMIFCTNILHSFIHAHVKFRRNRANIKIVICI